jgi:peptide/nickel transport system permease protein
MESTSAQPPSLPTLASLPADDLETPPLTIAQITWRRFRRHKMAIFGSVMMMILLIYAVVGAFIFTESYANFNDTTYRLNSPSAAHPFGTDTIGRDILARTIYGGQISLLIGLFAMFVEVFIGVLIGAVSGFLGGKVDSILMRFTEGVLIIPQLFLLLVMAKFFGDKISNIKLFGRTFSGSVIVIVLIIGLTSWPYLARIVRAQFLSLKENDFILAARATGTPRVQMIFRHILPNCIAPIAVAATLGIANAITLEAYISFLGLGVRPPTATWGNMLEGAYNYIETAWWLWLYPGALMALTVLSINFIGDGLRDALDPRSRAV